MSEVINVRAKIIEDGLMIMVDSWSLPIVYPRQVWRSYPKELKEILRDNIALSSTYFVPQILNVEKIAYDTSRPASEAFLFKNGIHDMASSAFTDRRSSILYIKKFINTVPSFKNNEIRLASKDYQVQTKTQTMIIPFTFGKDSLLTAAIAKEIGVELRLVYFVEPAHAYEHYHKKALMKPFYRKTGLAVQEVHYGPGQMRYGHLWNKQTELGWGLQTTEYALLVLPFLHYWKAQYIGFGNEHSCSESGLDQSGVLTYWSAYDQHPDWTAQQGLLTSIVGGRKIQVMSLVEPLHEIAEVAILHRRYPEFGLFQTSCLAIGPKAKNNRWCQRCEKCGSMYAFMKALNVDVRRLGFTEDLFDNNHINLFDKLFAQRDSLLHYAVKEEVFLALYIARLRGLNGGVLRVFEERFLPKFKRVAKKYVREFFSAHATSNLSNDIGKKVFTIYNQELDKVRNEIGALLSL